MAARFLCLRPRNRWTAGLASPVSESAPAPAPPPCPAKCSSHAPSTSSAVTPCSTRSKCPEGWHTYTYNSTAYCQALAEERNFKSHYQTTYTEVWLKISHLFPSAKHRLIHPVWLPEGSRGRASISPRPQGRGAWMPTTLVYVLSDSTMPRCDPQKHYRCSTGFESARKHPQELIAM